MLILREDLLSVILTEYSIICIMFITVIIPLKCHIIINERPLRGTNPHSTHVMWPLLYDWMELTCHTDDIGSKLWRPVCLFTWALWQSEDEINQTLSLEAKGADLFVVEMYLELPCLKLKWKHTCTQKLKMNKN